MATSIDITFRHKGQAYQVVAYAGDNVRELMTEMVYERSCVEFAPSEYTIQLDKYEYELVDADLIQSILDDEVPNELLAAAADKFGWVKSAMFGLKMGRYRYYESKKELLDDVLDDVPEYLRTYIDEGKLLRDLSADYKKLEDGGYVRWL